MKKRRIVFAVCTVLFLASLILVNTIGKYPLTLADISGIITGRITDIRAGVFFKIRLPRVLFCAIAGAVLALSGYAYQELFSNPLASPDILGSSSGASVGAAAAIIFGASASFTQLSALTVSTVSVAVTVALAVLIGRARAYSLLLSGIVVKALCDAALMTLKYSADSQGTLAAVEYRLMGSFRDVRMEHLYRIIPVVTICLIILYALRWKIRLLTLGDEEAKALGVPAGKLRVFCIIAATLPAAAVISVTGIVSWVGLIVPHGVRFLVKGDFKDNFGICAIFGAAFMMLTDTAARTLSSSEIPVSILTSFIGAAFLFAVLIFKKGWRHKYE